MRGDRGIVILLVICCAVLEARRSSHSHPRSKRLQFSPSIESSIRESSFETDESIVEASEVTSSEDSHSAESSYPTSDWETVESFESGPDTSIFEDFINGRPYVDQLYLLQLIEAENRRREELNSRTIPITTPRFHSHRVSHHQQEENHHREQLLHFYEYGIHNLWVDFCKEALEEEEPFMINDGAFHPRYEEVAGVGVYRLHARARSWAEARRVCEREGAQLAVPNSPEEAHALTRIHNRCPLLLLSRFNDYQYLGVHDNYNEIPWETVVGIPLHETGYVNWAHNQPEYAHHYKNSCLTMSRTSFYHNFPCSTELPFICEHS